MSIYNFFPLLIISVAYLRYIYFFLTKWIFFSSTAYNIVRPFSQGHGRPVQMFDVAYSTR